MVLTSSRVLMVDQVLQNGCCQCLFTQGEILLSLWEALQGQQMGLI